jgi:hypothetical protein
VANVTAPPRPPSQGPPPSKSIREIVDFMLTERLIDDPATDDRTRYRLLISNINRALSYFAEVLEPAVTDPNYDRWKEDADEVETIERELDAIPLPISDTPTWNPMIAADGEKEYVVTTTGSRSASRFREGDLVVGSDLFLKARNDRAFLIAIDSAQPLRRRALKILRRYKILRHDSQFSLDVQQYDRRAAAQEIEHMREQRLKGRAEEPPTRERTESEGEAEE